MNNEYKIREWSCIAVASCLQVVSFYASFIGINRTFLDQTVFALILAVGINVGMLVSFHAFQNDPRPDPTNDAFARRRALALLAGTVLLTLSGFLSTIGMYSLLGFQSGAETDANIEGNDVLRQTKEIFNKVKDAAAKKREAQRAELEKNRDTAKSRAARTRSDNRRAGFAADVQRYESKIKALDADVEKLTTQKANADEKLTLRIRNAEIQAQVANLILEYGLDRNTVLSAEDKKVLTFDTTVNRNLFDQCLADLRAEKPLAIASVAFGTAPDTIAVLFVFVAAPRRRLWRRIRDAKKWAVQLGREIVAPVKLPAAAAVEVLVNDENWEPLMQTAIPIDVDEDLSEEDIRGFFPQIIAELIDHFGGNFEIRELPVNWREIMTAGNPLELTAVEI